MERAAAGLRAIVTYKLTKAIVQLVLAGVLVALGTDGIRPEVERLAEALREHAAEGWSVALGRELTRLFSQRALFWTCVALAGDGVLSGVEGLLLWRGVAWARWLVLGAAGLLLPWELYEIFRHPTAGRLALFGVNAVIVGYLIRYSMARLDRALVGAR